MAEERQPKLSSWIRVLLRPLLLEETPIKESPSADTRPSTRKQPKRRVTPGEINEESDGEEDAGSNEATAEPELPMLLSKEFRWINIVSIILLLTIGISTFAGGLYQIHGGFEGILGTVAYWSGGALAFFVAAVVYQLRKYFYRVHQANLLKLEEFALSKIGDKGFDDIEKIKRVQLKKARVDFERNLKDAFLIRSLEIDVRGFFGPCTWQLKPGVNILLGRNGYGKSLILRTLAGMLQHNARVSKELFNPSTKSGFIEVNVERNGESETIRREQQQFKDSPGKIPILAIPHSRFVSRRETSVAALRDDTLDLRADAARHFLEDRPYGEMMRMLFTELCVDYLETRSFEQPSFVLLQKTIRTLSGDQFSFRDVERVGRNALRLLVCADGNAQPLPIQYASQGTLSVLGVVGIIRSYLHSVYPDARGDDLLNSPAIVLIDELDAHLHPLWQEKLIGILRSNFPNVQFVVSAHSPLLVAGCWIGEVAVLRKGSTGFTIEQLTRDFLGASIEEIYKVIFGVEDFDERFLQSETRRTSGFTHQARISELEKRQPKLTELERRELMRLIDQEAMIHRTRERKIEREDDETKIFELQATVDKLEERLGGREGR